ncbi:MAG: hypothetical protein IPP46_14960 [Bacteroidetes bacterium]|nr:hypothetical protein [Bacteroidota bacterium]
MKTALATLLLSFLFLHQIRANDIVVENSDFLRLMPPLQMLLTLQPMAIGSLSRTEQGIYPGLKM